MSSLLLVVVAMYANKPACAFSMIATFGRGRKGKTMHVPTPAYSFNLPKQRCLPPHSLIVWTASYSEQFSQANRHVFGAVRPEAGSSDPVQHCELRDRLLQTARRGMEYFSGTTHSARQIMPRTRRFIGLARRPGRRHLPPGDRVPLAAGQQPANSRSA
jgi:hypothetical protein